MDEFSTSNTAQFVAAKPTWRDEVVFVCGKCMRKQPAGVDAEGTRLHKWLRRALKREGLDKQVRVIKSGCFDLCPKRGVTLARGSELAGAARPLRVLRQGENPQVVLRWLLDG